MESTAPTFEQHPKYRKTNHRVCIVFQFFFLRNTHNMSDRKTDSVLEGQRSSNEGGNVLNIAWVKRGYLYSNLILYG